MKPELLQVTLEDFALCNWKNLPSEVERRESFEYSSRCNARAAEAEGAENERVGAVWRLLGAVTSTALRAGNKSEPFVADWLASFSNEHLALFAAIMPEVEDAELRARLCDVLWMRQRNVEMARCAVDSYLDSARTLEGPGTRRSHWRASADRYERATHIGRSLGRESPEFKKAVAAAEEVVSRLNGEDDSLLSAALMELLQDHEQGDGMLYAPLCAKASERGEGSQKWEVARRYRNVEAEWYFQAKQDEEGRRARLEVAELYAREGKARIESAGAAKYLQACPHLEKAIKAMRDIGGPGTRERIAELYRLLREWQKSANDELSALSPRRTIDMGEAGSELCDIAMEAVRGKDLLEAVANLGQLPLAKGSARFRAQTEEHVRTSFTAMLFPFKSHSSVGMVSGRPPRGPMTEEERLQAEVEHQTHSHANEIRHYHTRLMLEPALAQINAEHNAHIYDLRPLVLDNPFVPLGREFLFLKGLHAGLTGDIVTGVHILMPQIENSLRHLLEQHGVTTSSMTRQETQNWFDLNRMLTTPEIASKLAELLDEDVVFHLKSVLVDHFGANLRNELAHGTLGVGEFNGFYYSQCLFAWWLTLNLCLRRFLTPPEPATHSI